MTEIEQEKKPMSIEEFAATFNAENVEKTEEVKVESTEEVKTDAEVKPEDVKDNTEKETVKEEKTDEQKKLDLKNTKQFAEIAKRENELRRKERSIKENLNKLQEYEKAKMDAKKNPIAFVQQLTGMSFDDIINLSLTNMDVDPQKKIEEKLAAIEKEREEEKAARAKNQDNQAWNDHIANVNQYITENADNYEVILSHPERGTTIYKDLLDRAIEVAGRPLETNEVVALLNRTEQILTSEVKPLFDRLSKSKKFSSNKVAEEVKTVSEKVVTDNKSKTLTNDLATQTTEIPTNWNELSDEEKLKIIEKQYG